MRASLAITFLLFCSQPVLASADGDYAGHRLSFSERYLAQTETPSPAPQDAGPSGTGSETAAQPGGEDLTGPNPDDSSAGGADEGSSPDDLSLGDIPVIETIELTPDIAKRALDAYVLVKDKYQNSNLDQYDNPQDFVDQTADGKAFEADIKAAGFDTVSNWNIAITTVSLAYTAVTDDPTADIEQQIAEIEADTELAQDMKDRMIGSLKAMIPSENNKKVIAELMADPVYSEKLKQLDLEEE